MTYQSAQTLKNHRIAKASRAVAGAFASITIFGAAPVLAAPKKIPDVLKSRQETSCSCKQTAEGLKSIPVQLAPPRVRRRTRSCA